jgi:CO/xanthine dehydrogenase FAD-binding subunit
MLKIRAYHRPKHIDEAIRLLAEPGAGRTVIAGGTDLLVNPRYMVGVQEVVDVRDLGLAGIVDSDGQGHRGVIVIGAGATMYQVASSPLIQAVADGILARGAAVCGSPNIRRMATLGGNVASALPSADTPPALLALDARVVLHGPAGRRTLPLSDFFTGPAKSVREPGEIIVEFHIPQPEAATRGGFYKIGRTAEDISMVNAAVALTVHDGIISHARIALGAVAPTPLRARAAEAGLEGQPPTEEAFQQAAAKAAEEARPITDHRASAEYRRRMSGVCALRALRQAAGLADHPEEWHHA